MAFDNGAVLEGLQVGRIVPDVLAWTNWKDKKKKHNNLKNMYAEVRRGHSRKDKITL